MLFTVGGAASYGLTNNVSVVDIGPRLLTCPMELDKYLWNSCCHVTTMFAEDYVLTCGGYTGGLPPNCFHYNKTDDTWTYVFNMNTHHSAGTAARMNDTHWLITSGETRASEIYNHDGNTFTDSVPIIYWGNGIKIVKWNDTHYITCAEQTFVRIIDITQDNFWTNLTESMMAHHKGFCGIVKHQNGTQELVVGGGGNNNETEIYNFEVDEWRFGPQIPNEVGIVAPLCIQDVEGSFLVVGGLVDAVKQDKIYYFRPERYEWDIMPGTLKESLSDISGIIVPYDFVTCT